MPAPSDLILSLAILALGFLYSSVGHAGASGYIAAMSLAGVALTDVRPAALMMNLGVACFGVWHFMRGGHFRAKLAWPFLPLALPFAWWGARIEIPTSLISILLGIVLLFSAIRFWLPSPKSSPSAKAPSVPVALACGALLGFLAGLTGTGGGIFLTPLLLIAGWAQPKTAAAASILFIAGNSLFGLIGFASTGSPMPWHLAGLLPFALIGGFAGSRLGSFRFSPQTIRRLLAVVLVVASLTLLHQGFLA